MKSEYWWVVIGISSVLILVGICEYGYECLPLYP